MMEKDRGPSPKASTADLINQTGRGLGNMLVVVLLLWTRPANEDQQQAGTVDQTGTGTGTSTVDWDWT